MLFIFQIIGLFRQKRELYFWLGPKLYDANWLELCPVCWSVMSNECKVDVKVPIFPKMGGRTSKINVLASHAIRNSHILSSMFDQILKSVFHCSTVFPELQKITAFFRTLHNALIPTKRLPLSGGNEISTNELIRFLRCDVKRFLDTLSEKQYGNKCWCLDGCHFGNRIRLSSDNAWNDIFFKCCEFIPCDLKEYDIIIVIFIKFSVKISHYIFLLFTRGFNTVTKATFLNGRIFQQFWDHIWIRWFQKILIMLQHKFDLAKIKA